MHDLTTRRGLLITGGLGVLATAAFAPSADAKKTILTETEEANIKLVKEFLASWDTEALDVDALVAKYFAPNASARWTDNAKPAIGVEAVAAAAKKGMPPGLRIEIQVLDIWAHGPVVATSRVDVMKIPGRPDLPFKGTGIVVVKDGQFVEYCDYVITK